MQEAILDPFSSDPAECRGQPPMPTNMEAGEVAAQMPLQPVVAVRSTTTIDTAAQTAPAGPKHALSCCASPLLQAGGAHG